MKEIKNKKNNIIKKDFFINAFLNDIKDEKSKPLTDSEEKSLLSQYYSDSTSQAEKLKIKQRIVMAHQRFLFDIAKCYANGNNALILELISVGTIGLYECFDNFDITKNLKFITYAQFYIRRAINHYIETENLIVKPSNNHRLKPKVKKIEEDFKQINGRNPDIFEIENELIDKYKIKINEKHRNEIYGVFMTNLEDTLDNEINNDSFTLEKTKIFNKLSSVDNDYDVQSEQEGLNFELNKIISKLSKRESIIIKMAYGLDDYLKPYNNIEIGEALNLTSERVRQLKNSAEKKLKSLIKTVEI